VDDPSHATAIPIAVDTPNVLVSRTFSKIYGMAGLRCGYGVGRAELLNRMRPYLLESGINQLVAAGAVAATGVAGHVAAERARNRAAREYGERIFTSLGYETTPSHANFFMANIRRDAGAFQQACAGLGLLVGRPFPPLATHMRLSVGTLDEMRRAEPILRRVLAGGPTAPGRV
jgi:histidinol-phosphate aminotransferase